MKVRIEYKSGKVEIADIAISDYSKAIEQLSLEGQLVSIKIIRIGDQVIN